MWNPALGKPPTGLRAIISHAVHSAAERKIGNSRHPKTTKWILQIAGKTVPIGTVTGLCSRTLRCTCLIMIWAEAAALGLGFGHIFTGFRLPIPTVAGAVIHLRSCIHPHLASAGHSTSRLRWGDRF
jgi:hypothetical protein